MCALLEWPTFPVDRNKKPLTAKKGNGPNWNATTDEKLIRNQSRTVPKAGFGIATGKDAGFFVLDVDTLKGHGKDGLGAVRKLEAKHGKLPRTRLVRTPTGGLHYYFSYPIAAAIRSDTGKLAPGLDVKGDGGYVVGPGSTTAKGRYELVHDQLPTKAPRWLLKLLVSAEPRVSSGDPKGDPERIARALDAIPNDDLSWDAWSNVGLAVFRASVGSEAGFEAFDAWSQKSDKYDETATRERWDDCTKCPPSRIGMGTLVHMANEALPGWDRRPTPDDFYAYLPQHSYIYMPTREPWPAISVNSRLAKHDGMKASVWLDKNRPVEQMAWAPGQPEMIRGRLISDGGWVDRAGTACLNLYRPATIERGDAKKAGPWVQHIRKLYPAEANHLICYFAQRVQQPWVKPSHALVLGGGQGIGKDTLLEPLKRAVGPWNFAEVSPQQLIGRFNGFVKSVLLRISEARDLGDINRYQFYEHMKVYAAAPPDVLRCDEKHLREHSVFNCCGVIITTNYKADGIYLPADDRRHFVAWSSRQQKDFGAGYWNKLWQWYEAGGFGHVAAYLAELDLSSFDPKAPPVKTQAFWEIVHASQAPEDTQLAEIIEALGNPDAMTIEKVSGKAAEGLVEWLNDSRHRRVIPRRMERCGYVPVRNPDAQSGLWRVGGTRQVVYVRADLSDRDKLVAASKLKA